MCCSPRSSRIVSDPRLLSDEELTRAISCCLPNCNYGASIDGHIVALVGAITAQADIIRELTAERDRLAKVAKAADLDHRTEDGDEVAANPGDVTEWADIVILALDGAWRAGHEPQAIIDAIRAKQARNEAREWPDWRTAEPGKAIEHIR
jgi:hypothetical protein